MALIADGPLLVALVCLLAYAWPIIPGYSVNPDSHVALTYAIVDDHSLAIDQYVARWGIMDRAVQGGHYFTDKLPMESFLGVPVYAALRLVVPPVGALDDASAAWIRYVLTLAVVSLPAALGVGLLRQELRRLGGSPGQASLAAVAYGLGSLLWPFASLYFSHALAATCVLATWVWARRGQSRALVAASLGACIEAPASVPIAVALLLGAVLWWRSGRHIRWRAAGPVLVLAAAPIALTAAYETAVYGAPWRLGYQNLGGAELYRAGMATGFFGIGPPRLDVLWQLLVVPYRGLLVANPVLLMGIPAALDVVRHRRVWEGAALGAFGLGVLIMSGYAFWDGGASLGPRHLVSTLPLVFLAAGPLFRGLAAHLLTAVSVSLMLAAVAGGLIYPPELANPWTQAVLRAVQGDRAIVRNWGNLLMHREGWAGFRPLMLLIAIAWPWGDLLGWFAGRLIRARASTGHVIG